MLLQAEKIWWHKRESGKKLGVLQLVDGRHNSGEGYGYSAPSATILSFHLCSLSHLDQICSARRFLCASRAPSPSIQMTPWYLVLQLLCLGYWYLHWLVFMISVHEPWCLCLTSSLCFFLLSLLGFLRLWRQKQCPISSSFRARFLLWTIPSSSNFSGLTDILYHYLVFEGKSGIF